MDSHVRRPAGPGPNGRINAPTEHFTGVDASARSAEQVDLRQAYGFARGVARLQPGAARHGHRIVWVRRTAFACSTLTASASPLDDAFAVVGRHTQCTIVLADDPFVALRHVLVRSIALPAGGVALRVLDLHTGLGFALPDGTRHTSIFAEGPVALALGEYALVALPTESNDDQLPDEMPRPVVETPQPTRDQLDLLAAAMSPYRVNARPVNRTSRITLMPRPVMVGEPMPPSLGRLANGGSYTLTLSRSGRSATVTIAEEDLARGVVIGRSDKCHDDTLRRVTNENTSRVHVLVLRDGPVVHAYDLASTQGTFVDGLPTRRVILEERGTTLTLGRGHDAVRFTWRARA